MVREERPIRTYTATVTAPTRASTFPNTAADPTVLSKAMRPCPLWRPRCQGTIEGWCALRRAGTPGQPRRRAGWTRERRSRPHSYDRARRSRTRNGPRAPLLRLSPRRVRPLGKLSFLTNAGGRSTMAPSAHLQNAMAMAGASASRIKMADADTARTPTATAGRATLPHALSCTRPEPHFP